MDNENITGPVHDEQMSTPGVTRLDFNQAMNDFKIMFPEMPEDIIEAVLRSNKGVVDATIDELLKISTQNNVATMEQSIRNSKSPSSSSTSTMGPLIPPPPPGYRTSSKGSYDSFNTNNLYDANTQQSSTGVKSYSKNFLQFNEKISKDSLRYRNNWNPPLLGDLPVSFLRIALNETQRKLTNVEQSSTGTMNHNSSEASLINTTMLQQKMEENERNRQTVSSDDPELAQFLADERFAILLQNEEFVRELRLNQDFMSTLDGTYPNSRPGTAESSSHMNNNSNTAHDSDAVFKERLRNMSKVSKRKFAQLARLFSGKSKKNFQHRQLDNSSGNDYQYCEDFSNENYEDFRSRGRIN